MLATGYLSLRIPWEAAYQQAIDSGHAELSPRAALSLGELLAELGDLAGAKAVYQHAITSGHAVVAPQATLSLGRLLRSTPPSADS